MKKRLGLLLLLTVSMSGLALSTSLASDTRRDVDRRINLFEDDISLTTFLGGALGCRLSEEKMVDLPVSPVYQLSESDGSCQSVGGSALTTGDYFRDPSCAVSIRFVETGQQQFCAAALDKTGLGDGTDVQQSGAYWTLSPGNLYDLGAASLTSSLSQPYMQRRIYKSIATPDGTCNLEMRVYKNTLNATGLKSMVALHGGSWRARGFGFFGLEMTIPHFTAEDYVVFAPFYRLLDTKEAPAACHGATIEQVTEDAADALNWVIEHAVEYGAFDYPTVFGQSAGAHLATSLSVNLPQSVANAVLFYPPTDFTEFALRVQDGSYTNEEGLGILEAVMGSETSSIDVSLSPVPENTFPPQVESDPDFFPPMFLLHGLADELVVASQSTRLCGALGGNIDAAGDRASYLSQPALRHVVSCDERDSQMHLIREGDHALDVCLTSNILLQSTCLSGSAASRDLVADSVTSAVSWAASVAQLRADLRDASLSGSEPDVPTTGTPTDAPTDTPTDNGSTELPDNNSGTTENSTDEDSSGNNDADEPVDPADSSDASGMETESVTDDVVRTSGGGSLSVYLMLLLGFQLLFKLIARVADTASSATAALPRHRRVSTGR